MSSTERHARLKTIERIGVHNDIVKIPFPKSRFTVARIMLGLGTIVAITAFILLLT